MDKILEKLFEKNRWEYALDKGVFKGIDKGELRKLTDPRVRVQLYKAIRDGQYEIAPPHMVQIPKDNGEFRTVYVNENIDRIFLSLMNDLLFEICPEFIHKSCVSYQKGIGCGKIVQRVSDIVVSSSNVCVGWKTDLSKFFDSVPIRFIDGVFDKIEEKHGKSAAIDVLRKYYHTDLCFDADGNLIQHYQSLKQGCAVASFIADVVLYHIDKMLSEMGGYYVRYSDDCLWLGDNYEHAMEVMKASLGKMELALNPKKVEYLTKDKWFKFLGFSIKGDKISLSKNRIKSFQKEIMRRTIKSNNSSLKMALNRVNRYLYGGDYNGHSWATNVLPIVNSVEDIQELNKFVMDCLRASETRRSKVGGLGYEDYKENGVITRGTGRHVKKNREKMPHIDGYMTLNCARLALLSDHEAYDTLVRLL